VETAREQIAKCLGVLPKHIVFTSGGTEAANMAIRAAAIGLRHGGAPAPVLASATEHRCVLQALGHETLIEALPVDRQGMVAADVLKQRLSEIGPAVVAIQEANNETGVRQSCFTMGELRGEFEVISVCDAVQTAGRFGLDTGASGADFVFISAHKFGGPKGVGALAWWNRERAEPPFQPLLSGGGQERGWRAGTENVIGIAGMAAALIAGEAARHEFRDFACKMQSDLEAGIRDIAPGSVIFGEGAPRLPNTTCFAIPGVRAEMALIAFDLDGVSVSSGSACSSGKVERSHVLRAMGVAGDLCDGAIVHADGDRSQYA